MQLKDFVQTLPLGKVHSVKRYKKGIHNDTYKVISDKGKFSLRVYNYKKPSQIKFELEILKYLKDTKAPQLVKLNKGYLEKFNGKYVIVYEYLPGEELEEFTKEQLVEVGNFIGEYHNRCKNFVWDKSRYQFYNLPDWKIEKFTKISHEANLKHLDLLPEIVKDLKENRLSPKLPKGPIHVDIKPENVLFYNGKLSGVLDFDNSFIGPFILDLAKSMVWFGTRDKKFHLQDAVHIYQGYIEKRPLNKLEQQEMYKAVKFAFLSHVFVDYYMWAIRATTEEYFEFIVNDLYAAYKTFTLSKKKFDKLLKQ